MRASSNTRSSIVTFTTPVRDTAEIRSEVADIKNVGDGRWGGAITAAKFLERFVGGIPWTHVDIAGPAFNEGSSMVFFAMNGVLLLGSAYFVWQVRRDRAKARAAAVAAR